MKRTLSVILSLGLFVATNQPATAAIGYSLEECEQHWGEPIIFTTDHGTLEDVFLTTGTEICVFIENGSVMCIDYIKSRMTEGKLEGFRADNGRNWGFIVQYIFATCGAASC